MSDPQRAPGKTPRRAEPLQPDKPGRGNAKDDPAGTAPAEDKAAEAREQSSTAQSNVSEGYK